MCANGDKEVALTCRHFRAEPGINRHGQAEGNLNRDKLPYLLLRLQECRSKTQQAVCGLGWKGISSIACNVTA